MKNRLRILSLLALWICSLVCFAQVQHIEDRVQRPNNEYYDGIDVSKYQGDINWSRVAADPDVKFVYVKATEGGTHISPTFEENFYGAKRAGLLVGCYHFMRSSSSIEEQFENFKQYVKPEEQNLVPLIDIETLGRWTPREMADSLHRFCVLIYQHYGCVPMIYTSSNFYNRYLSERFSGYPLFIARYAETEPVLDDGTIYTLWQYTDKGRLSGISTKVDLSRFGPGRGLLDIVSHGQVIKNKQGKTLDALDVIKPDDGFKPVTPDKFKAETPKVLSDKELKQLKKQQEKEQKEAQKKEVERKREQARKQREQAESDQKKKQSDADEQKKVATDNAKNAQEATTTKERSDEVKFSTRRRKTNP